MKLVPTTRSAQTAFTLMELLLVMAIIIVVLGFGTTAIGRAFQRTCLLYTSDAADE